MGEEAPDPPALQNSLAESAAAASQQSSDPIQDALQQNLNTIQQIADHNAEIQTEQAQQSQTQQSGKSAYDKCEEANYAKMMAAPSDPHAAAKATNNDPCMGLQH